MIRVRRYNDPFVAEQAAQWLRSHGVPAEVVGHHVQNALPVTGLKFTQLDILVPLKEQKDEALRLLDEFERTPATLDEDWESQSTPDLSALDPSVFDAPCPSCAAPLPLDAALRVWPACAAPGDVGGARVARHGPGARAAGYASDPTTDAGARAIDVVAYAGPCEPCGATLAGLPVRGRCPRCGALYDKDDMLRRRTR